MKMNQPQPEQRNNAAIVGGSILLSAPILVSSFLGLLNEEYSNLTITDCTDSDYYIGNIVTAATIALFASVMMTYQQIVPVMLYGQQLCKEKKSAKPSAVCLAIGATTTFALTSAQNDMLLMGPISNDLSVTMLNYGISVVANLFEAMYRTLMNGSMLQLNNQYNICNILRQMSKKYFREPAGWKLIFTFLKSASGNLNAIITTILFAMNMSNSVDKIWFGISLGCLVFQLFAALPESASEDVPRQFQPLQIKSVGQALWFWGVNGLGIMSSVFINAKSGVESLPISIANASLAHNATALTRGSAHNCGSYNQPLLYIMAQTVITAFDNSATNKALMFFMLALAPINMLQIFGQLKHVAVTDVRACISSSQHTLTANLLPNKEEERNQSIIDNPFMVYYPPQRAA